MIFRFFFKVFKGINFLENLRGTASVSIHYNSKHVQTQQPSETQREKYRFNVSNKDDRPTPIVIFLTFL